MALVQTVDFITPVVNDPYDFGRIAAANALSDVYAMGGRPLTAMNIVCFPIRDLPKEVLQEILRGGIEKVHEAGAALVGGHSVEDAELKFGLSVTGIVHPDRVITNAGVRPGDALVITKALGTGVLATAMKAGLISEKAQAEAIETMAALNKVAGEAMLAYPVNACTDITGFGLLGHVLEMAAASDVSITLLTASVPLLSEVLDSVQMGLVPAGSFANRNFCSHTISQPKPIDPMLLDLLADAQTSGGLLISLPEKSAAGLVSDLRSQGIASAAVIGYAETGKESKIVLV